MNEMRQLVLSPKFKRAYRKFVRRDRRLQSRIDDTLTQMQTNLFASKLSTHKLSGLFLGMWSCSCGYDCRIVFALEIDEETDDEVIILLDIGTHDQVY